MKKLIYLTSLILLWSIIECYGQDDQYLALINANYLDVKLGVYIDNNTILIKNDQIVEIGKKVKIPKGAEILDVKGKYIIPGLIDSEVHFYLTGSTYARPDIMNLEKYKSFEEERVWAEENIRDFAKRYLKLGITTIIDGGGPLSYIKRIDSINQLSDFPTIYTAGPFLSLSYPKKIRVSEDPNYILLRNDTDAINKVWWLYHQKSDFIKIWINDDKEVLSDKEKGIITSAIWEAHQLNMKVVFHTAKLKIAKFAVTAGVDILAHSILSDPVDTEFVDLLIEKKVTIIPSLDLHNRMYSSFILEDKITEVDLQYANPITVGSFYMLGKLDFNNSRSINYGEEVRNYPERFAEFFKELAKVDSISEENLRLLAYSGVNIATGTDAGTPGIFHGSSYFHEIERMSNAGMTNLQIIRASTTNASKVLGLEDEIGTIDIGKQADLLILDKDPLVDIQLYNYIDYVIKSGSIIQTDSLIKENSEHTTQRLYNTLMSNELNRSDSFLTDSTYVYKFPDELIIQNREEIPGFLKQLFGCDSYAIFKHKRRDYGNQIIEEFFRKDIYGEVSKIMIIYKFSRGKLTSLYYLET